MKNKKVLFAVALPFVVLCLLIVRAEYHIRQGEQWSFELQGYDPRDLLRGHYLRLRVSYDMDRGASACKAGEECCLCLNKTEARVPKVHETSCAVAKAQCDGFMLSSSRNSLSRYYIPETEARRAEKILAEAGSKRAAFLNVSINDQGEPAITDLIIGNQSLNDLLKQPEKTP